MKKKKLIILIIIIITIITILGIVLFKELNHSNTSNTITKAKFYTLEKNYDSNESEPILITENNKELLKTFNTNKLNFKQYNYVKFNISYDTCSHDNVKPYGYEETNNSIKIKVKYKAKCGGCAPITESFLIEVPKNINIDEDKIEIDYKATNNPHCDPNVAYKPIIYLYPTEETNVKIELGNPNYLTTTYPKYNDSWNVTAYPNGTLKANNREYYSLFWEGNNHQTNIKEDGFIVTGNNIEKFLEEKLSILGLSDKEANEFIIYWLPKLENNKYNYIRFETLEEINNYMPLTITPEPDTTIRVLMDFKPLDKKIKVKKQKLQKVERNGFTVVEWGGSKIA